MAKKLSKKSVALLKETVAKRNRRVTLDNKKFDKMSASEKRVQIARDVLAQLASKRLIATTGTWLAGSDEGNLFSRQDVEKSPELQKVLSKTKECTGCALGGMFMCAVERADNLKIGDLSDDTQSQLQIQTDDIFEYMEKFFSRGQLHMIESAFEQGDGHASDEDAADWLSEVDEASERMRLIMENIVVNKGKFVLENRPVQEWVTPGYAA
jgi:hypothetical protein